MIARMCLLAILLGVSVVHAGFEQFQFPWDDDTSSSALRVDIACMKWYNLDAFRETLVKVQGTHQRFTWDVGWRQFGWKRYHEHTLKTRTGIAFSRVSMNLLLDWNRLEVGGRRPVCHLSPGCSESISLTETAVVNSSVSNLLPSKLGEPLEWTASMDIRPSRSTRVLCGYRETMISKGEMILVVRYHIRKWQVTLGYPGYPHQWSAGIALKWRNTRWRLDGVWHGALGWSQRLSFSWSRG